MATQTAHLKMSAPNYRAVSGANPLTLFTTSSQTSAETPVKNAFSAADGVEQPIPSIPGRLVLRTACNPATAPPTPVTYIIYTGKGTENAGREGSWGWGEATGSSHPIAFGRVERQIWQYERSPCHSGL